MNHAVTYFASFLNNKAGVVLKTVTKPSAWRAEDERDQMLLHISPPFRGSIDQAVDVYLVMLLAQPSI
jgi:hypothetical protein